MQETASTTESIVEQLHQRIVELERRVSALEAVPQSPATEPILLKEAIDRSRPPETWRGFPPVETPSGAVAVIGKAVLGMAGAYLLRAIADSGSVPKLPVLLAAIFYASFWMFWAVRTRAHPIASGTYAITSAMILSPLLWESTVRFQYLPPSFTALVLVVYFGYAIALGWRHQLNLIPWVATLATVATGLFLIFATHDLVPFTTALLVIALLAEVCASLGRYQPMRVLPALAADVAVLLLTYVMTASTVVPESYRAVAPGVVIGLWMSLLLVTLGGIAARSFHSMLRITTPDILQGCVVFLIAVFGALRTPLAGVAAALGVLLLVFAAGCYWGALARFKDEPLSWNRRVSGTWAALLLSAGSMLLFPNELQVTFLCLAAVVTTLVYQRTRKLTLGFHASVFLAVAAAVSPLPGFLVNALGGTVPSAPQWSTWIIMVAALISYWLGSRTEEPTRRRRAIWVFPAALIGFAGTANAIAATVHLAAGYWDLSASRLSVIRTVVNCGMAVAFAYAGVRWNRVELGWVAYAAVVFGTLKLLFEDLRIGNAASLVVSLLFYGLILILLPRLTRRTRMEGAKA